MNTTTIALLLGVLAAVGVMIWGLFCRERSAVLGVFAMAVAFLAELGAMYAWGESRSIPWTIGYAAIGVVGFASGIRQFVGRRANETNVPPRPRTSMARQALLGAFWCNIGMFLVAPAVAAVYQFPVIFNGKVVGIEAIARGWGELAEEVVGGVWLTLMLFIVCRGGIFVLSALGGLVGAVCYRAFAQKASKLYWRTIGFALIVDLILAIALAIAADWLAPGLRLRILAAGHQHVVFVSAHWPAVDQWRQATLGSPLEMNDE